MSKQKESDLSSLRALNPYLIRYKKRLILGLIFVLLTNVFNVMGPWFIKSSIDSLSNSIDTLQLTIYGLLIIGFAVGRGIFLFLVRQNIIVVSREIEYDLRNDLYSHLQKLSTRYYKTQKTGDIIAKNTNDINSVRSYLGPGIMYSANTITTFLFVIPAMLFVNWQLTLIALIPLPMMSYLVFRMGKKIHKLYGGIQSHFSSITNRVQENLTGIRIVKSYAREAFEIEQFNQLSYDYLKKNLHLAKYQAVFYSGMALFIGLSVILVIWFGGYQVIQKSLTLGELAQFIIYVGMLIWPMIALGWVINIINQASASQKRLNLILNEQPEIADNDQTTYEVKELKGVVEFKNVTFGYQQELPIVKNISLQAKSGEVVAITGRTGSGKSTLINLLLRLFDVDSGVISIDGIPIQQIPIHTLRNSIGYVPQDSFLFSDTIKNNIAFGVELQNEDGVLEVSEIAQIKENIETFPQQFETFVGERGITLSGGQKQRTTIARALLRNPSILILDDCLSAVDTHTEDQILSKLREVMKSRTTFIISHRISTIQSADKILVIDQGVVSESGTHQELIKLKGFYYDLYQKQLLEEELKAMS